MNKFKVGDTVTIRENFWKIKENKSLGYNDEMKRMVGETYTIEEVYEGLTPVYTLNNADWSWDEEWLEYAFTTPIKDVTENELFSLFKE